MSYNEHLIVRRLRCLPVGVPLLAVCGLFLCNGASLWANPAGSEIINVATVDYTLEGEDKSSFSGTFFDVAQLLDISLECLTTPVRVLSGETGDVSTCRLTNNGNDPDHQLLRAPSL